MFFFKKRDADVLKEMQTKGLLIRKYFVNLNCEVSSCKQGPLLALPQTPGGKSIQSPLLSRILWEREKKIFSKS